MSKFVDVLRRHCHEDSNILYTKLFESLQKHNDIFLSSNFTATNTCSALKAIHNQPDYQLKKPKTLILLPNPALVESITMFVRNTNTSLRTLGLFDGHQVKKNTRKLEVLPDVLIGTPARILDLLALKAFQLEQFDAIIVENLGSFQYLGYSDQLNDILEQTSPKCKVIITSKTDDLGDLDVLLSSNKNAVSKLRLRFPFKYHAFTVITDKSAKSISLYHLISELFPNPVVVYCNHRGEAIRVAKFLHQKKLKVGILHGGISDEHYENTLAMFRNGSLQAIITTDYTAVTDLPELIFLVHYNMPINRQAYDKRNQVLLKHHHFATAFHLIQEDEDQPEFIQTIPDIFELKFDDGIAPTPWWSTIKIVFTKEIAPLTLPDVIKLLTKHGRLHRDEIGMFEQHGSITYIAVVAHKALTIIERINGKRMNNQILEAVPISPVID